MKRIATVVLLIIGFFLAGPANAAPKVKKARSVKSHALVKTILLPIAVVKAAPKYTLKGIVKGAGAVLFTAEEGVDVAHVATAGLDIAVKAEFKHGTKPFDYLNYGVAKVDNGLEVVYKFLFHADI